MILDIFNSKIFAFLILPFLIFLSRILDQSVGIMRLIFAAKGYRKLVFILGFFESLFFLLAISQIMKHLDNALCYIAYPLGFATGNYIGILLEEKISMGMSLIRIIPKKNTDILIKELRDSGYGVTSVDAEGMKGELKIIYTIIKRKDIKDVVGIINNHNPNAFYSIEEVRTVKEGFFKQTEKKSVFSFFNPFRRKGVK